MHPLLGSRHNSGIDDFEKNRGGQKIPDLAPQADPTIAAMLIWVKDWKKKTEAVS